MIHLLRILPDWRAHINKIATFLRVFSSLDQRSINERLWEQPFQACAIYVDADCAVKPNGQNSVISFVILKWFSLKFSRRFPSPLSLPRPPRGIGKRRLNSRLKAVQSLVLRPLVKGNEDSVNKIVNGLAYD